MAADCTNLRAITLAEWNAVKGDMVKEEEEVQIEPPKEEEEEIIVEPDKGEMLVLRRVLNSYQSENTEQRKNIFHSRCTVHEKVCSIIIDGGSCANVVSVSMIEKLGLPTSIHPHPYDVQWLNRHKGLRVTSRCLISFSIGKNYQDKLWFDVLPMDVCHLILGRPWLYDRKVMHDDYLNTYSFTKDGKKIILGPLTPSQLPTKSSPKFPHPLNLFLTSDKPHLKALPPASKAFKHFKSNPPKLPLIQALNRSKSKSHQPHGHLENLRSNSSSQGENDGGPSKGTSYGPSKSNGKARIQDFAAKGTHGQGPLAVHCRTVVRKKVPQARIRPLFLPGFEAQFC